LIQQKTIWADKYKKKIYALLNANPQGLGFNELQRLTSFAKNTLKQRLDELRDKRFVKTDPEDPRKGQKVVHKLTRAWKIYNQKLEKLEKYGTFLLVKLLWFKYHLSKKRLKQEEIDKWTQGFLNLLTNTYFIASLSCINYVDRLKGTFFYIAHNIMRNRFVELSNIMRSYLPEQKGFQIKLELPGVGEGTTKEAFLAWVKDAEKPKDIVYREIEKMILEGFTLHQGTPLK